jgi:hypothetical protein
VISDKPSLAIGNGESRKNINLELLRNDFITIGCNAIHRDFVPDHLVCFDRRMAEESTNSEKTQSCKIYVRKDWFHFFRKIKKNKNVFEVPGIPYIQKTKADDIVNWGSGPYAVLKAAELSDIVYLLGFDLYSKDNRVNNLYKGTENYSKAESKAVDPAYWIHQIGKLMGRFYDKKFVIINDTEWQLPKDWNLSNVSFMNINEFNSTMLNKSLSNTAVFHGIQPAL